MEPMRNQRPAPAAPPFPRTIEALLEDLDRRFPEYLPTPTDSPETIMYRAGQRSVVVGIKERLAKANARD